MRAWRIERIGEGPVLTDLPVPVPGPGEVRVRIAACGLNFADLLMIEGKYQDMPVLPFIPGMEVAGRIEALGPGVTHPAVGTRVAVFGGQGGLAEAGIFAADRCRPIPDGLDDVAAAAFQIAYGTAHLALERRGRLRPGETLVVTGAAGGVGLTAVEIGRLMGARVIAVARGAEKLAVAQAAGAHHLIDAEADLTAEIRALGGADVVYDAVGGAGLRALIRATKPEGRVLLIGFASGTVPEVPANHLLVKNIDLIGVYLGGYLRFAPDALDDSLATLLDWAAGGRVRPHVSHVLTLDRATEGLDLLRSRRSTGKVVIVT